MHKETPFQSWESQQPIYELIRKAGMQEYVSHLSTWPQAFPALEKAKVCCMDEGIQDGIRAAGSLLLLPAEEQIQFCLKALDESGQNSIELTSHEGCGAAAVKYKEWLVGQSKDATSDYDTAEFDQFTQNATRDLVTILNQDPQLANKVVYGGHILLKDMERPAEQHIARTIYYDGSGHFNPALCAAVLPGFVISRRYQDPKSALAEVALALSIAFGAHGWAEKFTEQEPLLVVAIGNGTEESEVRNLLPTLPSEWQARIVVDHCLNPLG